MISFHKEIIKMKSKKRCGMMNKGKVGYVKAWEKSLIFENTHSDNGTPCLMGYNEIILFMRKTIKKSRELERLRKRIEYLEGEVYYKGIEKDIKDKYNIKD